MNYKTELKQFSEELHKRVIKRFPTRKVLVSGKNDTWGVDLNDMITLKKDNDGFAYILIVEDIYTRKAWAIPLKNKTGKIVADALQDLINHVGVHPKLIWCDKGGEFYSGDMTKLLKKYKMRQYSVYGESKVAPVERLNQTLKHIMFKILTEKQTHKWIDILSDVMDTYNNNKHSALGITPNEAYKKPNEIIKEEDDDKIDESDDLHLGDFVRISRLKGIFEKGYNENWSREVYQIVNINNAYPKVYYLNDMLREPIEGAFYKQELQKTQVPDFALVEKVVGEKTVKGKKQYLIKWSGWDKKFNSYVDANVLKQIK